MKKILGLALSLIMTVGMFAGCSSNKPVTTEDIKTRGTLYMVTEPGFAPFEYQSGDSVEGVDVDIAQYIADKLGVELEIIKTEFDAVIPAVTSGKADLGLAGISRSEDREKKSNLSITYFQSGQIVLSSEENSYTSFDDLVGKTVGAQLGTMGEIIVTDAGLEGTEIKRYTQYSLAVSDLNSGVLDAIVMDIMPATKIMMENPGLFASENVFADEIVIAMAKGNDELTTFVNECLQELIDSGEIEKMMAEHLNK